MKSPLFHLNHFYKIETQNVDSLSALEMSNDRFWYVRDNTGFRYLSDLFIKNEYKFSQFLHPKQSAGVHRLC